MRAAPTACPECVLALRRVVHQWYAPDCPDCSIRELAYLSSEDLTKELDDIERKDGLTARHRIYARVKVEKARIAVLSAAMPRREKA